jgi:hypothetical protein
MLSELAFVIDGFLTLAGAAASWATTSKPARTVRRDMRVSFFMEVAFLIWINIPDYLTKTIPF